MSTMIGAVGMLLTLTTTAASSENYTCFPLKSDFVSVCTDLYHGVADGARCFFAPGRAVGWQGAWDLCANWNGSVLAQLHTESEFNRVLSYIQGRFGNQFGFFTYALMDANHTNPDYGQPAIQANTTFWYTNVNESNPNLNAGRTWIRTRVNEDWALNCPVIAPRCFFYSSIFLDEPCVHSAIVLCSITAFSQNYTRTNYCISEPPVEETIASNPQDCATQCTPRVWCRSFNFVFDNGSHKCQLYSWSLDQECELCVEKTNATSYCTHYNYVP